MRASFGFGRRLMSLLGWTPRNRRKRRAWERRRSVFRNAHFEPLESRVVLSADAVNDEFSTSYATAVQIAQSSMLGNDTGTGTLSVTSFNTTTVNGGSVSYDGNGTYTYTPAGGFSGDDAFDYSIDDEDPSSDTATVTIHVGSRPNNSPTAGDDEYTINLGHNDIYASIDWSQYQPNLSNDSDPDYDSLSIVSSDVPGYGYGSLGVGDHTYSYTIDDGHGGQDTGQVIIHVTAPPNQGPTAGDDEYTINLGRGETQASIDWSQCQPNLANDSDPDYDSLSIVSSDVPSGYGTLGVGDHTYSYTIDDGHGGQDTGQVIIHVTASPNQGPTAVDDESSGTEDVAYQISTSSLTNNDTDLDGDPLTVTAIGTASHGTTAFDSGTGQITYTPNANWSGTDSFTYEISDGFGGVSSATVTITVNAVNDAPVRTAGAPSPITVEEDSANDTAVSLGLSGLSYGPGGGSDEAGQTLTYTITAVPSFITLWKANGDAVLAGATLNLAELRGLQYKTVADANGSGSVQWIVQDSSPATGNDTFTDTNDTPLDSHTMDAGPDWTVAIGTWEIENNRALVTSTGSPAGQAAAVFNCGSTDYTVSATVNVEAGNESAGVVVRYGSGSGTFYFAQVDTGDQNFCIYYFNGTWYDLLTQTSFAGSDETDYLISVTVSGDTITATVDGGNQISVSDCTQNASSTMVGIRADSIAEFDDFAVSGGNGGSSTLQQSLAVTVNAVNDAPVRTAGAPSPITVEEDSANDTAVSLGLDELNYGPGGGPDEAGQTLSYKITAVPSFITLYKADNTPVFVDTVLDLTELRGLKCKTVANANGSGSVEWIVQDDGGAAEGNDSFTDSNGTPLESHAMDGGPGWDVKIGAWVIENNRARVTSTGSPAGQAVAVFDSGATDYTVSATVNVEAGNESAGVVVRYGSGSGTFYFAQVDTGDQNFCIYYFNGTWYDLLTSTGFSSSDEVDYAISVTVSGATITATVDGGHQISASNCTQNSSSTLVGMRTDSIAELDDFAVSGGGGGIAELQQSLAVTVNAVNDAPVRTAGAPSPITVEEDSANDTAVSLGLSGLSYGPGGGSDEAGQTLTYTITAVPSFITLWKANGDAVLAGATLNLAELRGLQYKTVADANGAGELTWSVQDNGGTASGGIDVLSESLSITVFRTPIRLRVEDIARHESAGFVDVTFRLNRSDHNGVSVDFSTSDGSALSPDDYEPYTTNMSGDLYFAPGEWLKTVTYILKHDRIAENDETFTVTASNISEGEISDDTGVVTILGDPTATVTGAVVGEAGEIIVVNGQQVFSGQVTVSFQLSRSDHLGVTLRYRTIDGPAVPGGAVEGLDYGPPYSYVTFAAGQTVQTVQIDILNDSLDEPDEFFTIELVEETYDSVGSAFIDPTPAAVIIQDNDGFTVEVLDTAPLPIVETGLVQLTVSIFEIDPAWTPYTYQVLVQTAPGTWLSLGTGQVPAGQSGFVTTAFPVPDDFPLTTYGDYLTFRVVVANPAGETNYGDTTILVLNQDPTVTITTVAPGGNPQPVATAVTITYVINDIAFADLLTVRVYVGGTQVLQLENARSGDTFTFTYMTSPFLGQGDTIRIEVYDDDSGFGEDSIYITT